MTGSTDTIAHRLGRLVRDPLSMFIGLGAGIFGLYALAGPSEQDAVRYTPEIEQSLVSEFELLAGRDAQAQDIDRLKHDYLTDELLFREAVDRGIYLTDAKIRAQMIEKVRYLVAGAPPEPGEEAMLNYYAENLDQYESEPEISFEQVFFEQRPADPDNTLAALRRGEAVGGDDLWTGSAYPHYGVSMIRGIFGQEFLQRVVGTKDDEWVGPLKSSRGWHFVRKSGSAEAKLLPYGDVRDQVRQDLIIAEMQRALDKAFEELQQKYEVRVDA